jgi:hypothetical protein
MKDNCDLKPSNSIWQRGAYMLLFAFLLGMAKFMVFSLVILQFIIVFLTNSPNEKLLKLGRSLGSYVNQIILFLTFNSEEHPYPFSDWPSV